MWKAASLYLGSVAIFHSAYSQTSAAGKSSNGFTIAVGIHKTSGDFSNTHQLGASADISPARQSYRLLSKMKIALTYNGGVAYYFGKQEEVVGFNYHYPGFLFVHAYGGVIYTPVKKIHLNMLAGPALGVYNGNGAFNIGARLDASYTFPEGWAIGPALHLMKEFGTGALWSAGIRIAADF